MFARGILRYRSTARAHTVRPYNATSVNFLVRRGGFHIRPGSLAVTCDSCGRAILAPTVTKGFPWGKLSPKVTEGWLGGGSCPWGHPSPPNGGAPLKGSHPLWPHVLTPPGPNLFVGVGADSISARKVRVIAGASALGGQNDGRHPAKLARSCGSMPHWGIDRYATPQRRPLHTTICGP